MTNNWKTMTPIFLIGVGVGAAIGVLFAAKSGDETLEQISTAVDDVSGVVNDGVDEVVKRARKIRRRAERTFENARETVRNAAEAGEQAFGK